MATTVCEACGASNPADATFCQSCHAFVGWDRTSTLPAVTEQPRGTGKPATTADRLPRDETPSGRTPRAESPDVIETRTVPKITEPVAAVDRTPPVVDRGPVLAVRIDQDQVTVPLSGQAAELAVTITNRSDIVDGYEVDVAGAPSWLRVESGPLRLLPGGEEPLAVRFRMESDRLVAAGRGTVRLRIRSLTQPPAHEIVTVTLVVPVVDAPVRLRTEPSVLRLTDVEVGRFVVIVDNGNANAATTVALSGSDPELAVDFHFDPAVVVVGPGESTRVRAVTTSARPRPGGEVSRTLTVSATERGSGTRSGSGAGVGGARKVDTTVTLLQATSAVVEDPMVEISASPSLVRVRDGASGVARLSIDNRGGRNWATVRLSASDPERVVAADLGATEVRVPPGGSTDVDVRLTSPPPAPGSEVTHAVTLSATDGRRTARAELSLVHSSTASPMTTLALQLDPSVLRLGSGRRGTSTVMVDNRAGALPARVWLRGDDPENALGFGFTPPELTVGAGQVVTSRVAVTAPRASGGGERTRSLTVAATDGRTAVTTTGTLIQVAADRRPWARVLLTLLGALGLLLGAFLPVLRVSTATAFDVTPQVVVNLFTDQVNLLAVTGVITLGLIILVLAGLMAFGLTGRSGRLTRWSAVLAVLLTVGLLITVAVSNTFSPAPGTGSIVIIVGAVLGYIGGLLARR